MQISVEAYQKERIKGARIMVVFRWMLIILMGTLVLIQHRSGYETESIHALRLLGIYMTVNILLTIAVLRSYDPPWLGYASAVVDMAIILFHLHNQSIYFDPIAISAASTLFLVPFLFLLYTLRLDRRLLIFVIIIGIAGLGGIYAYHYYEDPDPFSASLSLSPVAQGFKMAYILFLGIICVYYQYSIFRFIKKQLEGLKYQSDLNMQITLEKQKSAHAKELERINENLEQAVQERTRKLTEVETKMVRMEKENLQSQFEVLKQQVNPHFLFNSLNTLTSLIRIDPPLAVKFTAQLSRLYRYALENRGKDLISLEQELEFLEAYIFLLDIRFKDKVIIHNHLSKQKSDGMLPPQAMQLLLENAVKHNTFSKKRPLTIDIAVDPDGWLVITNNLQQRERRTESTGIGLANIHRRYALFSVEEPVFEERGDEFVAMIPLINNTENENKNV